MWRIPLQYHEIDSRTAGCVAKLIFSRATARVLMTTQLFHDWPLTLDNFDACFVFILTHWLFINPKQTLRTYLRYWEQHSCQVSCENGLARPRRWGTIWDACFLAMTSWKSDFFLADQVTIQCILDKRGGSRTFPGIFGILGDLCQSCHSRETSGFWTGCSSDLVLYEGANGKMQNEWRSPFTLSNLADGLIQSDLQ